MSNQSQISGENISSQEDQCLSATAVDHNVGKLDASSDGIEQKTRELTTHDKSPEADIIIETTVSQKRKKAPQVLENFGKRKRKMQQKMKQEKRKPVVLGKQKQKPVVLGKQKQKPVVLGKQKQKPAVSGKSIFKSLKAAAKSKIVAQKRKKI